MSKGIDSYIKILLGSIEQIKTLDIMSSDVPNVSNDISTNLISVFLIQHLVTSGEIMGHLCDVIMHTQHIRGGDGRSSYFSRPHHEEIFLFGVRIIKYRAPAFSLQRC